jgi:hypothetical protein
VDWTAATFFDRVIHGLWLEPDDVRAKYDLAAIASAHRPLNDAFVKEWRHLAPGSDATVIEFDFRATGNAKRKLLRRLNGHVLKRRGGFKVRSATSLSLLDDYALAYDIIARECGGALLRWGLVPSPISD